MSMSFLATALLIVSLLTNLTVEGIKKTLDKKNADYSSNLFAIMSSIVLAVAVSAAYLIMNDIAFTLKIGVQIVALMYLSFLTATVGYDKVIQMFAQINAHKY